MTSELRKLITDNSQLQLTNIDPSPTLGIHYQTEKKNYEANVATHFSPQYC